MLGVISFFSSNFLKRFPRGGEHFFPGIQRGFRFFFLFLARLAAFSSGEEEKEGPPLPSPFFRRSRIIVRHTPGVFFLSSFLLVVFQIVIS